MDAQSEATLQHLLPDLAKLIAAYVPDDALLFRLEDRWDTFSDGSALRTMTADFAPEEDAASLKSLRGVVSDRMARELKHIDFDEPQRRDVYQKDRTVMRVGLASTLHPQGYEIDTVRVDAKIGGSPECPFSFSAPFERFRTGLGDGRITEARREHAMNLEDLAQIAVATERARIAGVTPQKLELLTAAGFTRADDGVLQMAQATSKVDLSVRVEPAPDGATLICAMRKR